MSHSERVLAVFAHPDDETFCSAGLFAALTDGGHVVTLVCATRGEAGEISEPGLATPDTLGEVREGELRAAMHEVGVDDLRFFAYRDSGMAGSADNEDPRAFMRADDETVIAELIAVLREIRPSIVITFGEDGLYGHPDHLMIGRLTTEAVKRVGSELDPQPSLYLQSSSRELATKLAAEKIGFFAQLAEEELARFGVPEATITTRIDVSAFSARKLAAFRHHRTQFGTGVPFADFPDAYKSELLFVEQFIRVDLPWSAPGRDPLAAWVGAGTS